MHQTITGSYPDFVMNSTQRLTWSFANDDTYLQKMTFFFFVGTHKWNCWIIQT